MKGAREKGRALKEVPARAAKNKPPRRKRRFDMLRGAEECAVD